MYNNICMKYFFMVVTVIVIDPYLSWHCKQRGDPQGDSGGHWPTVQPERDLGANGKKSFSHNRRPVKIYICLIKKLIMISKRPHPWNNDKHARGDVYGEEVVGELSLENHQDLGWEGVFHIQKHF